MLPNLYTVTDFVSQFFIRAAFVVIVSTFILYIIHIYFTTRYDIYLKNNEFFLFQYTRCKVTKQVEIEIYKTLQNLSNS